MSCNLAGDIADAGVARREGETVVMDLGRKATIGDVSRLSGHSPSTVSAVLYGSWEKRRIRAETAEVILSLPLN